MNKELDTHLVLLVLNRVLPYEFQFHQLEQFISIWYTIKDSAQVRQGFVMAHG